MYEPRSRSRFRWAASTAILAIGLAVASPAAADSYRSGRAGHPIRVTAYVLHPLGVLIETLIFRPAHWVGSQEPLKALFGHTD